MNCINCRQEIVSNEGGSAYPEYKWKHIDGFIACERRGTVATPQEDN